MEKMMSTDQQVTLTIISKGTKENATMPDRNSAYTAIWQAVKDGKIKRGKCRTCGSSKTQAHHPGKYKGIKGIVWLCRKHHNAAHGRSSKTEIAKSDQSRRLVYLVVAKPKTLDTDEQWFMPHDIEVMAHRYLIKYALGQAAIYEEHDQKIPGVFVAESYLAPVEFNIGERTISPGTWIVTLWVPNDEIWAKIQSGELRGASPRGPAELYPYDLLPSTD